MSLAQSQPVPRRLIVISPLAEIQRQIAAAKEALKRRIDLPIELKVKAHPDTPDFDLTFVYEEESQRDRNLIVSGTSMTREGVALYIPSDPEATVEAVLS